VKIGENCEHYCFNVMKSRFFR